MKKGVKLAQSNAHNWLCAAGRSIESHDIVSEPQEPRNGSKAQDLSALPMAVCCPAQERADLLWLALGKMLQEDALKTKTSQRNTITTPQMIFIQ